MDSQRHSDNCGTSADRSSHRVTDGAGMRIHRARVQIDAAVQLRSEKDCGEEQRQEADPGRLSRQFVPEFSW
jgi:hypothetical protein